MSATAAMWPTGAAYIDGRFMPVAEAMIPVTEWGYRRSDVTYDVVSVWDGAFFKLDDHLKRFRASMNHFRLIRARATMTSAASCTSWCGAPGCARPMSRWTACAARRRRICAGIRRMRATTCWRMRCPYVWLMPREVIERGAHLIVASNPRIPEVCVNPRAKNFHWADMTQALFEAQDKGADNPVLLDLDGNVTEGPGFNVFAVTDGVVATPDRGVLEGITRLSVIQMCEKLGLRCEVRTVPLAELRNADEVFISSTAGGVMGVTRLDDRILGNDRPGPLTEQLHDAYWRFRREGWDCEPIDYARAEAAE